MDGEGKRKEVFEVGVDQLPYTLEVGRMFTSILSLKVHQDSFCEDIVHFWKKGIRYADVLSEVNYEKHR